MAESYDCIGDGDCSYSWLDELLCEYVDGTMDPAVRQAFEEYLGTDPVLAQQVECLRCTRTLLCRHGCQVRTPQGLQARVRRRLAWEMVHPQPPYFLQAASRLNAFVAVGSVVATVVMVSLLVGVVVVAEKPSPVADRTPAVPDVVWHETRAGWQPATMTPLSGRRPHGVPSFVRPTASMLLPLASPYGQPQPASLQRTGVAP